MRARQQHSVGPVTHYSAQMSTDGLPYCRSPDQPEIPGGCRWTWWGWEDPDCHGSCQSCTLCWPSGGSGYLLRVSGSRWNSGCGNLEKEVIVQWTTTLEIMHSYSILDMFRLWGRGGGEEWPQKASDGHCPTARDNWKWMSDNWTSN